MRIPFRGKSDRRDQTSGDHEESRRLNGTQETPSTGSASSLGRRLTDTRSADRLLAPDSQSLSLIDETNIHNNNQIDDNYESRSHLSDSNRKRKQERDSYNDSKFTSLKPRLARAETMDDEQQYSEKQSVQLKETQQQSTSCTAIICRTTRQPSILIPLIILSCMAAIYCIPFVEIEPRIPKRLPNIPFNYQDGPLRASNANLFKAERLFVNQVHGPESIALDSFGNMYMAIEGGFILYAHLNSSSPMNRAYINNRTLPNAPSEDSFLSSDVRAARQQFMGDRVPLSRSGSRRPELIKIAELNPIKQVPYEQRRREGVSGNSESAWRRECQVDEKIYGKHLWLNEVIDNGNGPSNQNGRFTSKVQLSRCSKPLGIRLSPDENHLYVIDTLNGLYKIHLKHGERQNTNQRLVTKLIDFKSPRAHLLPVTFFDLAAGQMVPNSGPIKRQALDLEPPAMRVPAFMNISLKAVDDLVIDYGAGSKGSDVIYLSVGSQNWNAVSFFYDLIEGRPSGAILRYDTGSNHLTILSPNQVSHVRTAAISPIGYSENSWFSWMEDNTLPIETPIALDHTTSPPTNPQGSNQVDLNKINYNHLGAPRLDEDDVFDDRALHFPNGLELTDDRQALLISDTANKRIIKHFIKGPRKGTSDLWAWTPNFPDNIRRGHDKREETYWVAGCGQDTTGKIDILAWLNSWPRLRKFMLKNVYLFGWIVEASADIFKSNSMRDFGYSIRMGHSLCQKLCPGMMILQYNSNGDLMRSIHSEEFPNDLAYYSQANEVIDEKNQQHYLYLSSPQYDYVTKLILPNGSPTDTQNER